MTMQKVAIRVLLLASVISLTVFFITGRVEATGGAFTSTKHGGGTTDGETPCAGGVNRGLGTDYSGNCASAQYLVDPEAGSYLSGECAHCHEPHARFGGIEPSPSFGGDAGPDPYLLMKEYGGASQTTQNYANLCWYCHENISNINGSGSQPGYGRWSFYQGKTVFEASSHYTSTNFSWPGDGLASPIWPRKDRSFLPSGNKGSCLNCHTPHGIKASDPSTAFDTTSPDGTGGVPASMQTVASGNPSVMSNYMIPRQLISWEENLCERCHDASGPSSKNIQDEINKRIQSGGSGHPVDDTTLAGRHVASEPIPITSKHVECYDCHNPHAVKAPTGALGDGDGGRVRGMKYVDINGTVQNPLTMGGAREPYIYEICFKCHGNTWDQVFSGSSKVFPSETIYRPPGMSNKRLEFDPSSSDATYGPPGTNNAYHPVASSGKNTSLALCLQLQAGGFPGLACANPSPSLSSLTINCTDCHNSEKTGAGTTSVMGPVTQSNLRVSDRASVYANTFPVGPHGSQTSTPSLKFNIGVADNGDRSILRDYYFTGRLPPDRSPFIAPSSATEFQNRFKLCFNCHDWNTFYGNNNNTNFYGTGFVTNLHAFHLRAFNAGVIWLATYESCMTCHYNVHSNVQATNTGYDSATGGYGSLAPDGDTHLVNFAPGVVSALNYSKPTWYYEMGTMYCNLRCHGIQMNYSYNCSHSATTPAGTTNTCND